MDQEIIKKAIEKANSFIVKLEIKDPELKKIAFSKAVDYFLGQKEGGSELDIAEVPSMVPKTDGDFWNRLSKTSEIENEFLKDIFTKKNNQILLVIPEVKGKTKADKQRHLSILILFAYHGGLNLEWIPAKLLAEAADHSGLYDTYKFAENIIKSGWFRTKGKKRGLQYKLSASGINEVKNYLRELANL